MPIHTTPSLQKNNRIGKWFLCLCLAILAVYPIYRNFYYSNGLLTYERHRAVIENRSEYYNPWQYRILCPYTIEALLWVYNITIDKVYPIEKKVHFSIQATTGNAAETDQFNKLMQTPGAMKYLVIFFIFRFFEHILIYYLAWKLWNCFIKSKWLIFFGINFLALALGNAVAVADLSFNTYMDIIFYLIIALVIVKKKNAVILLPITILAAFNRETGILIPALYFISQTDFTNFKLRKINVKAINFPKANAWLYTGISYLFFFVIFISIRMYFGYRPPQLFKVAAGLPMLKLNLFSVVGVKAYMELIGTYAVVPFLILYKFKRFPHLLQKWFLFIVPVWIGVHYLSVVAYQTRLFMVPFIIIMMPMLLWFVEDEIKKSVQEV
jgi:hypothetical protein